MASTNKLDEEAAIPNLCLCGCGADGQHCYRPSRPPSPNTFFETFFAPNFVKVLESYLRRVEARNEPSARIMWRRIYGGDAQDESPSPVGTRCQIQGGRLLSPGLATDTGRICDTLNEEIYGSSNLDGERSTVNRGSRSGPYSAPLDLYVGQNRKISSKTSKRRAEDSRLRAMRATLRMRAGLDRPTPPNKHASPLESQIKSLSVESPPKLFDFTLRSTQPKLVHASAKEDNQLSKNQKGFSEFLQFQLGLDVPAQPKPSLTLQDPSPVQQKDNHTEYNQPNIPRFLSSPIQFNLDVPAQPERSLILQYSPPEKQRDNSSEHHQQDALRSLPTPMKVTDGKR